MRAFLSTLALATAASAHQPGSRPAPLGARATATASAALDLPECTAAVDTATTTCIKGDAANCPTSCTKCTFQVEAEASGTSTAGGGTAAATTNVDVCLPTSRTSCREDGLGSVHLAYAPNEQCPTFSGSKGQLTGKCHANAVAMLTLSKRADCQAIEAQMGGLESAAAFTADSVKLMCTNSCIWTSLRLTNRIKDSCDRSDLLDKAGSNSAAMTAGIFRAFCMKNAKGQYCGTVLAATGAVAGRRRSATAAREPHPVRLVRDFVAHVETTLGLAKFKNRHSAIKALQVDCSSVEQIKPQFDQLREQLGCCLGEIFKVMFSPEVMGGDSGGMSAVFQLLKDCGLDLFADTCVKDAKDAAKLKASLKLRIKDFTEAKRDAYKISAQADIAANIGVYIDRVEITKFEPTTTQTRAVASGTDITIEYTVLGDNSDTAGLDAIKADIDAKGAAGFKMTNTDVEAGGDGSGSSAALTEAPKSTAVTDSSGNTPTPTPSSSSAGVRTVAVGAAAFAAAATVAAML
jgi:hypothetical protein